MNGTPPVSCMCLTYGRPHLLEEAIESFLRQEYPGAKELVVLNDLAGQELVCGYPEVRVLNLEKRFRSLGEKRNACAALCTHDLMFVWDDDDVYLPWRISYSVARLDPERMFFKPSRALTLNHGRLEGPSSALFHSGACWHRDLFDLVRGYAHIGVGEDLDLEQRMEAAHVGEGKNFDDIPPEEIYYLYRWAGSGSYHLSGFGPDRPGEKSGQQRVAEMVAERMARGEIPAGRVELRPRWGCDYVELAREYVRGLAGT